MFRRRSPGVPVGVAGQVCHTKDEKLEQVPPGPPGKVHLVQALNGVEQQQQQSPVVPVAGLQSVLGKTIGKLGAPRFGAYLTEGNQVVPLQDVQVAPDGGWC